MTDTTLPTGKWEFDADVTAVFDDMLSRSIPNYDTMRDLVFDVGRRFVVPGRGIVDLGCSRGEALRPFVDLFGDLNYYLGIDVSDPMLDAARKRFKDHPYVVIDKCDLRLGHPIADACLTLSVLTLQFTPIEHRHRVLRHVYDRTIPGGAFILVEKVLGCNQFIDDTLVDVYLDMKRINGYSEEQIRSKRLSLEGVLVPVTAKWNEDMLREAGFRSVECFWRWSNFAGWLAVK
jgi:tRNA (cmo5U34)-methyltransferase